MTYRFIYITRAEIPSQSARSVQIISMVKSFSRLMKSDFALLSSGDANNSKVIENHIIPRMAIQYAIPRYVYFIVYSVLISVLNPIAKFFTRDIIIAFVLAFFRREVFYEAHNSPQNNLSKFVLSQSKRLNTFKILAISQALSLFYEQKYDFIDGKNIFTYHDCADPDDYKIIDHAEQKLLRASLQLPDNKILITHTGSLYKGGAEVFGWVATTSPDIFFIHVGGSSAECLMWTNFYKQLDITNICFLPYVPRHLVIKYQQAADYLLYSNVASSNMYWCTSPLKLFEYMASYKPIIGSCIGSIAEILNEKNSYLFQPHSPSTIRLAVLSALSDKDKAFKKALRCRNQVEKHFNWDSRAAFILQKLCLKL